MPLPDVWSPANHMSNPQKQKLLGLFLAAYGSAAVSTSSIWGPQITGNVIVVGTAPVYHYGLGQPGALKLIQSGISFATATTGNLTGAYICLSCTGALAPEGYYRYRCRPGAYICLSCTGAVAPEG
jgi:hypothetical protein